MTDLKPDELDKIIADLEQHQELTGHDSLTLMLAKSLEEARKEVKRLEKVERILDGNLLAETDRANRLEEKLKMAIAGKVMETVAVHLENNNSELSRLRAQNEETERKAAALDALDAQEKEAHENRVSLSISRMNDKWVVFRSANGNLFSGSSLLEAIEAAGKEGQ